MKHSVALLAPVLLLLALPGCGAPDPDVEDADVGEGEVGIEAHNGVALNGCWLNGRSLNGRSLNGKSLNGVSLDGIALEGQTLSAVQLEGSMIKAQGKDKQALSGVLLAGATLEGEVSDGSPLELRIDDVHSAPAPNDDVTFYVVSYSTEGGWEPLCDNPGNEAIALSGVWDGREGVKGGGSKHKDDKRMTFGCHFTALAKCVELGYKPWSKKDGKRLDEYHEACVRAIRADYCGNGVSYTTNGTPINIFDKVDVQADTETWAIEAIWDRDGAKCIDSARFLSDTSSPAAPECVAELASKSCKDTGWGGGALLRTEVDR